MLALRNDPRTCCLYMRDLVGIREEFGSTSTRTGTRSTRTYEDLIIRKI